MLEFIHLLKLVSAVTSSKKPFLTPRLESFPLTCVAPELCFVICQNIKNEFLSLCREGGSGCASHFLRDFTKVLPSQQDHFI